MYLLLELPQVLLYCCSLLLARIYLLLQLLLPLMLLVLLPTQGLQQLYPHILLLLLQGFMHLLAVQVLSCLCHQW
jgi:hypothetical protein